MVVYTRINIKEKRGVNNIRLPLLYTRLHFVINNDKI